MKRNAIIGGAALAALVAAFLAGRFSRPPQPQSIVYSDSTASSATFAAMVHASWTQVAAETRDTADHSTTRTITVWKWLPGGTVEATATTVEAKDVETHETHDAKAAATQDAAIQSQQTIVTTHTGSTTYERPAWSIALMPGVDLRGQSALPYHAVVGASVERRILGPLFLGLSGNTAGVVGITVRGSL